MTYTETRMKTAKVAAARGLEVCVFGEKLKVSQELDTETCKTRKR